MDCFVPRNDEVPRNDGVGRNDGRGGRKDGIL